MVARCLRSDLLQPTGRCHRVYSFIWWLLALEFFCLLGETSLRMLRRSVRCDMPLKWLCSLPSCSNCPSLAAAVHDRVCVGCCTCHPRSITVVVDRSC